jgi:hypothetical protein
MTTDTRPEDFRVAGLDWTGMEFTEPVIVTCQRCKQASPEFAYRDDGGADRTASLADLIDWAAGHDCEQGKRP